MKKSAMSMLPSVNIVFTRAFCKKVWPFVGFDHLMGQPINHGISYCQMSAFSYDYSMVR